MQKRVLILDDDKSVCDMLDVALTYYDFSVKTSGPPENILDLIDEYHPDILLIDYFLQAVNGIELCCKIKENPITTAIPVVMISAYANNIEESDVDKFDAVLHKPFRLDELLEAVNHLI